MTTRRHPLLLAAALLTTSLLSATTTTADEGMWLLNDPPIDSMQQRYDFAPSPEWLEHLQKSACRFGASASFVSADGLVLTNHHVARSQIAKLSTPENDYLAKGFLARTRADEIPFPDASLLCLQHITDVTDRVKAAAAGAHTVAEAEELRQAEIAAIELDSKNNDGLHAEVVALYDGGLYHLYQYDRFTDIRLVFAPEGAIAHFGGDVDNFEFPRWCLDIALVRVYDHNGNPYNPPHHLTLSTQGLSDGEPVFVVGHPGRTQRLLTLDHLRHLRDIAYPNQMHWARSREIELRILSSQGDRQQSLAKRDLMGYMNWRKGTGGKLRALQDPRIFDRKVQEERDFRSKIARNPDLQREVGDAFEQIALAQHRAADLFWEHSILEGSRYPFAGSRLFSAARTIVRLVEEREKPDSERLDGFHESQMPSLELRLYSPAPIYDVMEISRLESHLAWAAENLGAEHRITQMLLGGLSPRDRAIALVRGTSLAEPSFRRSLVDGGKPAVISTDDTMIQFVRTMDRAARAIRKIHEDEVDAVERDAYARLAAARFAIYGSDVYPDATFSLRLATGTVKGFDLDGTWIEPFTEIAGVFDRFQSRGPYPPFDLPQAWQNARSSLDLATPFNFASTNDIIGGNSGSPIVNRDGHLVGVVFDGNRYGFIWDVLYTGKRARCVSVDARAIIEALSNVYHADHLVNELLAN